MSSPFPSCFRPSHTTDDPRRRNSPPPPRPPASSSPNLTTYLYHTDTGLVTLSWSRSILGRSLHIHVHNHNPFDSPPPSSSSSSSSSSFQLHIKPFIFWKKHGSKTLSSTTRLFWNLSKAKFSSSFSPEPHSSFYLALVVHNRIVLLLGDSPKDAYSKCKALHANNPHSLLLKKEHVFADTVYSTTAIFGGKTRRIQIDCGSSRDDSASSKLSFSVDGDRVLQIKRLKWKFRGNERVEIDGVPVQISWDVYNWLFDKDSNGDGHAIFMFKFEEDEHGVDRNVVNPWAQQNWSLGLSGSCDWAKMSSSSVSVGSSAGSFGGSSSVLEWSSVEENELVDPVGFSLIVYAWKR